MKKRVVGALCATAIILYHYGAPEIIPSSDCDGESEWHSPQVEPQTWRELESYLTPDDDQLD